MVLSDEQIAQFQALYKSRFGEEISKEEAYAQGIKLIRLVEIIYRPMTKEEYSKVQARRKQTAT